MANTHSGIDTSSYDDRDGWIWVDGEMVEWRNAKTHLLCHGMHYGSGVFEGERCYSGKIFKMEEHHQRLIDSANMLGMKIPYTREELDQAALDVLAKNNITEGYLRPLAWRGSEMMAISAQNTTIHVMIAAWYWPSYFSPELKQHGIKLKTAKFCKMHPSSVPTAAKATGLYIANTLSKHEAEAEGYHDCMMLDYQGNIAEATGANIFFVMNDGKIHTPTPTCFLDGITRRTVMQLARDNGFDVIERTIKPEELKDVKEVFLTGTAAEVTPVGQIDNHKFTPAKVTHTLIDAYAALVKI